MKDVPDWLLGLVRNAYGDLPSRPDTSRWGKVKALNTQTTPTPQFPARLEHLTYVSTDWLPEITPIAVELRFSLDGVTYSPTIPLTSGATLQIDLTEAVDQKTGAFHERFTLGPGDGQSFCTVIAKHLTVDVTLIGENQVIYVAVICAPVQTVDCADATGKPAPVTVEGYTSALSTRFDLSGFVFPGTEHILTTNPNRRQFFAQNYGDTDVGLLFNPTDTINWTLGSEQLSIVLPGGFSAVYESPVGAYTGNVWASVKPGGPTPTGFLLVTDGTP